MFRLELREEDDPRRLTWRSIELWGYKNEWVNPDYDVLTTEGYKLFEDEVKRLCGCKLKRLIEILMAAVVNGEDWLIPALDAAYKVRPEVE
jgi:hypothetical protein